MNLGEVLPGDNGKDKIDVTTDLQAFGLIVTAKPYYAVTTSATKWLRKTLFASGLSRRRVAAVARRIPKYLMVCESRNAQCRNSETIVNASSARVPLR